MAKPQWGSGQGKGKAMAARKSTLAKKAILERMVYWIAQQPHVLSGDCPYCGEKLLKTGALSDIYEITMDHLSKSYDHTTCTETKKAKGGQMMHRTCHKSMTAKENGLGKHKRK